MLLLEGLVQEAQAGDKQAYKKFLDLLYPQVQAIIRRKLGALVDTDDITQECIMGIHKNLSSYHCSRPLGPWISAILRYKLADHFKRVARLQEQSLEETPEHVTNALFLANEAMGVNQADIRGLVSDLPDSLARAIELTQIEGISYAEAAQKEGISEPALRKRVSRAYQELRQLVMKEEEGLFHE